MRRWEIEMLSNWLGWALFVVLCVAWLGPFALVAVAGANKWLSRVGVAVALSVVVLMTFYVWWFFWTADSVTTDAGSALLLFYFGPGLVCLVVLVIAGLDRCVGLLPWRQSQRDLIR
jgi:hypothetical protein